MFKIFKKDKKEPKDLKEILKYISDLEERQKDLSSEIEKIKKEGEFSVQKVGIIRFNPFKEVGGDQSFSLALLDAKNDGVVITSLYTREENRVYGKPIKNGESEYLLSEEEKEAMEKAKSKKQKEEPR